jgi:RecA-family ATPase
VNDDALELISQAAGIGPDGNRNSRENSVLAELPRIVDCADFLAQEIPKPPELVRGILHKATKMVVGGGSKTFKTWTLSDLGLAVAFGEPWLSFKTSKGRVLFINFEIPPAFFQHRIRAIEEAKNITLTPGQFDLWNLRGFAASYDLLLPRIIDRTKEQGYVLIILDPIYKLYGNMDENKAGDVARLMNALEDLTVKTEAAVAFGAHYSKGNQSLKETIDRISGSGVFARDPDTILNFTKHQEKDAFTVEATLRNFKAVEPFVVRWQYPLIRTPPRRSSGSESTGEETEPSHSSNSECRISSRDVL